MTLDHHFLTELTPQDQVITANRRLASHLLFQFEQLQREQHSAWATPAVIPLSHWLTSLWARLGRPQRLLDSTSSLWLWQEVLKDSTNDYPLLDYRRAAELAQEAWEFCHQWKISFTSLEKTDYEEVNVFLRWVREFQIRCEKNAWCDESLLPEMLIPALSLLEDYFPERLYLVGFDTLPPSIQQLLDELSSKIKIIVPSQFSNNITPQKIVLNNRITEFRLLAQWAKKCWLENPQQRIGCIVPELLSDRLTVERAFYEEFNNELSNVVNIAGGDSLLSFSLIQTVSILLDFTSGQFLQQPKLTSLLLSPYLKGAGIESDQRAILDREVRKFHQEGFVLADLMKILANESLCTALSHVLSTFQIPDFTLSRYPSEWSIIIQSILIHFGWPGERNLNSIEFQCVKSFQQQLQYYGGLDDVLRKQTFRDALDFFRNLLSQTLFQAQSDIHAPVQVLGLLEASGLYFDQLWITSMNDDTWPRSPTPNPFLPMALQRKYGVPRSSSGHELKYAQRIMNRIAQSTSQLIASYSLMHSEEQRELSQSPLIEDFKETSLDQLQLVEPEIPFVNPLVEDWQDDHAPPVQDAENVRGGATILQRQAQCPFRAFVEMRLKAQPFDDFELGLSASDRGSLVHSVMAEIWKNLGNSAELKRIDTEKLNNLIEYVVANLIEVQSPMDNIEITRLIKLVQQWLALEKTRADFSVTAIEKPFNFTIGKLNLRLQVDRIDTLSDGTHLILDYKTGTPSPNSWFGERPDEPQLPLYALHDAERVRGLAFAQIRTQTVKFNGITSEAGVLPKVKASPIPWETLLEQWEINLTALADDFFNGYAAVDPKNYPTTCQYCHLASVCRINEKVSD